MIRVKWYELACDSCGKIIMCSKNEPTDEQIKKAGGVVNCNKHYCCEDCYSKEILKNLLAEANKTFSKRNSKGQE